MSGVTSESVMGVRWRGVSCEGRRGVGGERRGGGSL